MTKLANLNESLSLISTLIALQAKSSLFDFLDQKDKLTYLFDAAVVLYFYFLLGG